MSNEEWSNVQSYRPISRPIRFVKSKLGHAINSEVSPPVDSIKPSGSEISSFYADLTRERATSLPLTPDGPLEGIANLPVPTTSSLPVSNSNSDTEDVELSDESVIREPAGPTLCQVCNENVLNWKVHAQSIAHILASNPSQPKPPTFYAIKSTNIGRRLLEDSGWDEETGLGIEGQGRKAPIKAVEKKDKLGIGLVQRKTEKKVPPPGPIRHEGKGSLHYARVHKAETEKWKAMYRYLNAD